MRGLCFRGDWEPMRELPKSGEWKRKTWSNGIGEYPSEAGAPSIVTIDPSTFGTPLQFKDVETNVEMAGLVGKGGPVSKKCFEEADRPLWCWPSLGRPPMLGL